jgi:hypothetical protein
MRRPSPGAIGTRLWFGGLIAVSAALLVVTFASYPLVDHRRLAGFLFWLGLGGEGNIGAWWSGMLLALAGLLAFDGFVDPNKSPAERRGWRALGFALLLLSFDEIAALHEYLSQLGRGYLAVLGVVGLSVASYGMRQLHRARAHTIAPLLLAFGLLATVPFHELLQHRLQWDNQVVYGLRAVLEEGTEVVAALIFVSVGRATSASLLRGSQDFLVALVWNRRVVTFAALLLWPVLTAATFALPQPGGPADWLTSTLFLGCALLAVRAGALRGGLDWRALSVVVFYVAASAAAAAMKFQWDPIVLGTRVSLRGIAFALLVLTAVAVLNRNGRPLKVSRALLAAAGIAACAVAWPSSQILWCGLPPVLALWLFGIESKTAAQSRIAPVRVDPVLVPVELVPAGSLTSPQAFRAGSHHP